MSRRGAGAFAALAVAAVVVPLPARAYLCTRSPDGPSLAWPARTIELRRANVPDDLPQDRVDAVLGKSAATWTAVDCSDITLSVGAPTDDRRAGFDWAEGAQSDENVNVVVFRDDDPDDPVDRWMHSFQALAITTVTFVASSGRILDADVEFNSAGFRFTACELGDGACQTQHDLENTLTHELGHVIGLDHPLPSEPGAQEATMHAVAAQGDVQKRDLADDDVAGACAVYPTAAPAGECYGVAPRPPPAVRFEPAVCGQGSRPAPLVALLALVVAMARRGRGRQGSCSTPR